MLDLMPPAVDRNMRSAPGFESTPSKSVILPSLDALCDVWFLLDLSKISLLPLILRNIFEHLNEPYFPSLLSR